MATHSSIPAWRIPWTEEPGGLQSMGLQRIGTISRLNDNCQHPRACGKDESVGIPHHSEKTTIPHLHTHLFQANSRVPTVCPAW